MQWEWKQGNKHYSVRYFKNTGKLIWSGWINSADGPLYDEGRSQPVDKFLAGGAPIDYDLPDDIAEAMRQALAPSPRKTSGLFNWFKREQ